tara:strand:+ start:11846 stop:12067 length:222 start_codon:yes stop_codon:yes gene_type:complete
MWRVTVIGIPYLTDLQTLQLDVGQTYKLDLGCRLTHVYSVGNPCNEALAYPFAVHLQKVAAYPMTNTLVLMTY